MPNVSNVSGSKPKTTGIIFCAPVGTTLPTDASTALAATFMDLGYVSDSGVTNSTELNTKSVAAFGGDIVLYTEGANEDTFKVTLIESLNTNTLKFIYGDDNVTVDGTTGLITIKRNSNSKIEHAMVIDLILRGGALKRIAIPRAQITNIGDIVYNDSDPTGYELELSAFPDDSKQKHYEYILPATKA